jgi:hypothetical protein
VRNDVGKTNRVYRNAVDAFFGRDRAAALTGFDLALKLQPNNKLVQRLRARALRLPVVDKGMSPPDEARLGDPELRPVVLRRWRGDPLW